jgi:hypothetical protein
VAHLFWPPHARLRFEGAPSFRGLCERVRATTVTKTVFISPFKVPMRDYNYRMARPIRVDNSRPATVRDTARTLGVSKRRTDELVEQVRQMIYRDAKTGQIVIRAKKSGTVVGNGVGNNRSRNGSTKAYKTTSRRAKASR